MRHNIWRDCWLQQRPSEFTFSFNSRREICHYCSQLNFDEFYVRENPPEMNLDKTA